MTRFGDFRDDNWQTDHSTPCACVLDNTGVNLIFFLNPFWWLELDKLFYSFTVLKFSMVSFTYNSQEVYLYYSAWPTILMFWDQRLELEVQIHSNHCHVKVLYTSASVYT